MSLTGLHDDVLETLDLIADCTNRMLKPPYPEYPHLKLKATAVGCSSWLVATSATHSVPG